MPRILIVDDEASLLMTLVANLELEGYDVLEAETAEAALALVREQQVDLVLTDVRLPGMSGVDLFQKIHAIRPELPVILMTAFTAERLVDEAIQNGAFAVLPKPFDIDHLVQVLTIAARLPCVLVVDDEGPVAESTAEALRAAGLRALAVEDGSAALEHVRTGDCDVCVVDLVMPDLAGDEVIERIREIDGSVGCVAISGHDVPGMFRRAAEHAAVIMRKPVPPEKLIRTVADIRRQKRPTGPER